MRNRLTTVAILCLTCIRLLFAKEGAATQFHVDVDMVVLTFTVTDANGRYVSGLGRDDIVIREDGVRQKPVIFTEGTGSPVQLANIPPDAFIGTKVFVLFDTSNWMYTNFPYASDAIADFVRRLGGADSIAVYKFSRNLYRAVLLTGDREQVLSGVRSAVAGDDTALYNALLLTLRDAAKVTGRKVVVVFSNGPDNSSIVSPDDVSEVAQDEGVPVYIVSTRDAERDPISENVFQRLTARTGGRLFWAQTWQKQAEAFASIREDLNGSYTIAYYPAPNANAGFRTIKVDIRSESGKRYQVRVRSGYHAPKR